MIAIVNGHYDVDRAPDGARRRRERRRTGRPDAAVGGRGHAHARIHAEQAAARGAWNDEDFDSLDIVKRLLEQGANPNLRLLTGPCGRGR